MYKSTLPVLLIGLMFASAALSEPTQKKVQKADKEPIIITSNSLEIDNKREMVTFTGHVDARRNDLIINSQKMLLYYNNVQKNRNSGDLDLKIDTIVAIGQVRITRPDGALAIAEKAVYYQKDDKVVLTGKPVVKQGNDFVEGSRITLYLKEKRSVVEGSEEKRVRAVLFPRREGK